MVRFPPGENMGYFLFATSSRPALGPNIQCVPATPTPGEGWTGRGADHSPPSGDGAGSAWSCASTPPTRLYGGVLRLKERILSLGVLISYRQNFIFVFYVI